MNKVVSRAGRIAGVAVAAGVLALAGGCTPLRAHQGYIIDVDLVNSVQPGVDNRTSVMQTLGKPTFASQFNQGDWYYIARDTRNLAYQNPRPASQLTLKIAFDSKGVVSGVTRTGVDQVVAVNPYNRTTPTLGRKRGFFEDLFGNIGAVGAGGGAGQGGGSDEP